MASCLGSTKNLRARDEWVGRHPYTPTLRASNRLVASLCSLTFSVTCNFGSSPRVSATQVSVLPHAADDFSCFNRLSNILDWYSPFVHLIVDGLKLFLLLCASLWKFGPKTALKNVNLPRNSVAPKHRQARAPKIPHQSSPAVLYQSHHKQKEANNPRFSTNKANLRLPFLRLPLVATISRRVRQPDYIVDPFTWSRNTPKTLVSFVALKDSRNDGEHPVGADAG